MKLEYSEQRKEIGPAAPAGAAGGPSGMVIRAIWRICSGIPSRTSSVLSPAASIVSPFSFAWVSRVSTKPKATALELILKQPHSLAIVLVSPVRPALAEE